MMNVVIFKNEVFCMTMKTQEINPVLMSQYNAMLQLTEEDSTEKIKSDIMQFFSAGTIAEAKKLFKKIFPNCEGKSHFRIQGVEVSVCEKEKMFRLCADFGKEYFGFDFDK